MHFQGYHFSLSSLSSGLRFPPSPATLRILLVPLVWIPVLGCVWGQSWCPGDFSCPAFTATSQPIPVPRVSSCSLAGRLLCPPSLLPAHPQQHTVLRDKKRDSYCLVTFFPGLSASLSTVNFDFSVKLKWFSSEALKNIYFSALPPLHLYTLSSLPALQLSGGMRSQSPFFAWEHSWSCLSFCITHCVLTRAPVWYCSPRCWNTGTEMRWLLTAVHGAGWRT